jgi:hypothetical protein
MSLSTLRRAALACIASVALFAAFASPASASDLAVTAANVVAGSDAVTKTGTAGEALTAGQAVYQKAADLKWYKADCNSATAAVRVAQGIVLTGSGSGQSVVVQTGGTITIGATVAAGTVYFLSGTPGGVRPAADNTTGDYPQVIGMGQSTTTVKLNFKLAATSAL